MRLALERTRAADYPLTCAAAEKSVNDGVTKSFAALRNLLIMKAHEFKEPKLQPVPSTSDDNAWPDGNENESAPEVSFCVRCRQTGHRVSACKLPDMRKCNFCEKIGHIQPYCQAWLAEQALEEKSKVAKQATEEESKSN